MPKCEIYVSPNTITDLKAYSGTSLSIDTNEWTVSGDYLYASWWTYLDNLTFKATGYQDKTQEIEPGSNYVTMVAVPPKYISKLSDGTNTYVIKDAEARSGLSGKQDTLVSGTNIKTIGGTSLLGSGNIALPTTTIRVWS